MSYYHNILGIRPGASKEELKKAYRKKALLFHPDKNKAADAHEKFVEITMAYEYLMKGTTFINTYSPTNDSSYSATVSAREEEAYKEWQRQAKEKAERQAKYRYEKFKKENEAFKRSVMYPLVVLMTSFSIFLTGAFALFFFSLPFVAIYNQASWWVILVALLFSPPSFFWYLTCKGLIADLKDIMN